MSGPKLKPIHSTGFFSVYPHGEILQRIVFYYKEDTEFYGRVIRNPRLLAEEKELLRRGMENILDSEEILVNGSKAVWRVMEPDIVLLGSPRNPVLVFHVSIEAPLKPGRNVYEEFFEPEKVGYGYEAYWYFPPCMKALNVEASGHTSLLEEGRLVVIKVEKEAYIEGYESIVFSNNCSQILNVR
ncbi:MAG: hypothetical protein LRS47_00915 [Desulfurococcales archaeon]|nr:hypothetical protein [Desulfurococcales archaeon]